MADSLRRVGVKVFFYYLVTVGGLLTLLILFPDSRNYLPVGGIDRLNDASIFNLGGGDEATFRPELAPLRALGLLVALVGTLIYSVPLAWVYSATRERTPIHDSLLETIFLLPIAVASVVMVVQNSIALAFSLAGIVAAVRFRSSLKEPADAVFVFAALAVGLASGVSALGVAGVGSMVFSFTVLGLRHFNIGTGFGKESDDHQ